MLKQFALTQKTTGDSFHDITQRVNELIATTTIATGLCNIFLHHTSASIILCENADPRVQTDLKHYMQTLVPDGTQFPYEHTAEGPDDMPAHIRTILTQSSLSIPITSHHLALGTWQGLYLWEHRNKAHARKLTITLMG